MLTDSLSKVLGQIRRHFGYWHQYLNNPCCTYTHQQIKSALRQNIACSIYQSSSVAEPNITLVFFFTGDAIAQLTDAGSALPSQPDGRLTIFSDRTGMVKAARLLLSSVTKVLVLADRIVIKQITTSRNKVKLDRRQVVQPLRIYMTSLAQPLKLHPERSVSK